MHSGSTTGSNGPEQPVPGARAALYLLLTINLFNYIDRQVLSAVLPRLELDNTIIRLDDADGKFKLGLLTSAFLVTRAAIPALRAAKGCIINNLSLSVQTGGAGGAGPYAAAKGALQVMTRTLARELAPEVRTNAIMPGVIETRHHEVFSTPERMEDYRRQTPLGRNSTADEVAQAVVFLASDAASFMTGAISS